VTDAFRHRTTLQVRFADTDAFGHVNNAVFATYAELARIRYLLDVLRAGATFDELPLILARLAIDFRSPILFDQEVIVASRVERIGRSSFTMRHEMTAGPDGRVVAEVDSVLVTYDYANARPMQVPDAWRTRFGEHEGRSFELDPDAPRPHAAAAS
jgi:acyl-CoA thioester hydrolase